MKKYEIHLAAGLVPLATKEEQLALQNDIEENGQREPAALYRGKIVDGRCRYLTCQALDIELKTFDLPNNMSIKDVEAFVKSVNTRRNLTRTQKVMSAYREMLKTKLSGAKTATRWGLTATEISKAKYISENMPIYAEKLFNGESIIVGKTEDGKNRYSSAIIVVWNHVKFLVNDKSSPIEEPGSEEEALKYKKAQKIVDGFKASLSLADDTTIYNHIWKLMIEQGALDGFPIMDKKLNNNAKEVNDLKVKIEDQSKVIKVLIDDFNKLTSPEAFNTPEPNQEGK